MNKAIFLDRDGVINELVFNPRRNEYEPPFRRDYLKLYPGVIEALKKFTVSGYKLFLVSNQPDFAKGKTKLENLAEVHDELDKIFFDNGVHFDKYFYCYHHPDGIVEEYSVKCECRKPGTLFVDKAVIEFGIDRGKSWFIGDRDKDILCGKDSGLKTIWIRNDREKNFSSPDFTASDLEEAMKIVLGEV